MSAAIPSLVVLFCVQVEKFITYTVFAFEMGMGAVNVRNKIINVHEQWLVLMLAFMCGRQLHCSAKKARNVGSTITSPDQTCFTRTTATEYNVTTAEIAINVVFI